LLTMFLLAAPRLTVGGPVVLADTAATAMPTDEGVPLTVTISADGSVSIQETETPRVELVAKLQAVAAERTSDRIYLRADGANSWDAVAQIMGDLNAAGFSNIGLVTDVSNPDTGG